jgi:adenosine 3'-phospho 5'-phosphosulfate transporter B3
MTTEPLQQTNFFLLAIALFVAFGIHNLLQEAIMTEPGFNYGLMLGYFEVLGVTLCSSIERKYVAKENGGRTAPLKAFALLTVCLMSSSSFSNMSLNYINYPTKVVFRSCKLLPTMMIATIMNSKVFTINQYFTAAFICLGMVMFALADSSLTPSFQPIGLLFVLMSVCADSVLPNAQEKLFSLGSSRLEVTVYTNVFVLIWMTVVTTFSGDLLGTLRHAAENPKTLGFLILYTLMSYIAVSIHMYSIKRFGGVTTVLLGTTRKGMTIILSFIVFPKPFSWYYVVGGVLVLGGLTYEGLRKKMKPNANTEMTRKESYDEEQISVGKESS